MEFLCRITQDSGMDFGERNRAIFKRYLSENPGRLLKITPVLPESGKQRRFLEGAVIPLVTYYQEGMSHTSHEDCDKVREWLKLEFNGDFIEMHGKVHRIGKSTKGRDALQPFLERVVDWLIENYQPPCLRQPRPHRPRESLLARMAFPPCDVPSVPHLRDRDCHLHPAADVHKARLVSARAARLDRRRLRLVADVAGSVRAHIPISRC